MFLLLQSYSRQQPATSFNETNINTICSCQQLAPGFTTDIQVPITVSNLNDTSNFTQKAMLKIEAQLSALKSYADSELSTLTSKIDAFWNSLKNALANLQKRESNYANTDLPQQNITSLENELKLIDRFSIAARNSKCTH